MYHTAELLRLLTVLIVCIICAGVDGFAPGSVFPSTSFLRLSAQKEVSSYTSPVMSVVDIGINLTHGAFGSHWRHVVQRAIDGELSW